MPMVDDVKDDAVDDDDDDNHNDETINWTMMVLFRREKIPKC